MHTTQNNSQHTSVSTALHLHERACSHASYTTLVVAEALYVQESEKEEGVWTKCRIFFSLRAAISGRPESEDSVVQDTTYSRVGNNNKAHQVVSSSPQARRCTCINELLATS